MMETGRRTKGNMLTMDKFAAIVKGVLEQYYRDCRVAVREVEKNNGKKLTGIEIRNTQSNVAPVIYLEEYYRQYLQGRQLAVICKEIADRYEENKVTQQADMGNLLFFDTVKENICFKLINAEKNAALLREVPYRPCHDLAVVYFVLVSKDENGTATITVNNALTRLWDVSEEVLYAYAKKNTPRLLGGTVAPMTEVFPDLTEVCFETEAADFDMEFTNAGESLFVATNSCGVDGASILLYDSVLELFSERIGSDFYILPSSVHELLFVPKTDEVDGKSLSQMVREVNRNEVAPEEVLSDHVYYYHTQTKSVKMVA